MDWNFMRFFSTKSLVMHLLRRALFLQNIRKLIRPATVPHADVDRSPGLVDISSKVAILACTIRLVSLVVMCKLSPSYISHLELLNSWYDSLIFEYLALFEVPTPKS